MKKQLLALSFLFIDITGVISRPRSADKELENRVNAASKISSWFKDIQSKKNNPLYFEDAFAPGINDQSTSSNTQLNDLLGNQEICSQDACENEGELDRIELETEASSSYAILDRAKKHLTKENIVKVLDIAAKNVDNADLLAGIFGYNIPLPVKTALKKINKACQGK